MIPLLQEENVDNPSQFSSLLSSIKEQLDNQYKYNYKAKHEEDSDDELSYSLLEREEVGWQETENKKNEIKLKIISYQDKETYQCKPNNKNLLHLPPLALPTLSIISPPSSPDPSQASLLSPTHQPLMQKHNQDFSRQVSRRDSAFSSYKRDSQASITQY